ncbi:hypothetical protein AGMMS50212_15880 [Spirochaetia bacterium]|nr:hypothetical protein AGMMS50212_15880 [Spirochaetia bacterium]
MAMLKKVLYKDMLSRNGTQDSRSAGVMVKDIPIGDIVARDNVRKNYSGIEELAGSIRQHGLLQPIMVYKDGDQYVVKTGRRRFMAYQSLYKAETDRFHSIRCIVSDSENVAVIQLVENIQRENLSQIDLCNALSSLRDSGMKLEQIAAVMGKTEGYIKSIFVGINEIEKEPEFQNLIGDAGITIRDIAETKCVKNKDERLKLLEQRKKGVINRAQMRMAAQALKDEKTSVRDEPEVQPNADAILNPEPCVNYVVSASGLTIKLDFSDTKTTQTLDKGIKCLLMRHKVKIIEVGIVES